MRKFLKKTYILLKKFLETNVQFLIILIFCKFKYLKNIKNIQSVKHLLIIGNGPSLLDSILKIEKNKQFINIETLCVNNFAHFKYYEKMKPKYYVIIDPVYFIIDPNNKSMNVMREELISTIKLKTNWPISFYIPRYYIKSKFVNELSTIKNIDIIPINNVPLFGGFTNVKHFLFDLNLGNPVYQNVLAAAIFIGVKKNIKNIFLIGSDHSWLNNLQVLSDNNVVLNDNHFIESKENFVVLKEEDGTPKKIHKFLYQLSLMFEEYLNINIYAEKKGIIIKNLTCNSFIDAFRKTNIDESI